MSICRRVVVPMIWIGPDNRGQMRKLAHKFAELMNYEGGYCIVQNRSGDSSFSPALIPSSQS